MQSIFNRRKNVNSIRFVKIGWSRNLSTHRMCDWLSMIESSNRVQLMHIRMGNLVFHAWRRWVRYGEPGACAKVGTHRKMCHTQSERALNRFSNFIFRSQNSNEIDFYFYFFFSGYLLFRRLMWMVLESVACRAAPFSISCLEVVCLFSRFIILYDFLFRIRR